MVSLGSNPVVTWSSREASGSTGYHWVPAPTIYQEFPEQKCAFNDAFTFLYKVSAEYNLVLSSLFM